LEKILIFEDFSYENFYPLTLVRTVSCLKIGTQTIDRKVQAVYPDIKIEYLFRPYLTDVFRERYPDKEIFTKPDKDVDYLLLNARYIPDTEHVFPIEGPEETGVDSNDQVIYIRISGTGLSDIIKCLTDKNILAAKLPRVKKYPDFKLVTYPWELIPLNRDAVIGDYKYFRRRPDFIPKEELKIGITGNPDYVWVAFNSKVEPFVEINTENGPVIIDSNTEIHSFTRIEGPAYIGNNCRLLGAKIRAGTSLFDNCRVGGEVEESILFGNSNHYHHGFIGHSIVGEWVNIGALTATSDLKNNYGKIKMDSGFQTIQTDQIKIGSIIGDFTKLGIGTLLNTGSILGISANIFGGGIQPKFISSFSWGGKDKFLEYDIEKGIETNKEIMKRRKLEWTAAFEKLYRKVFELTKEERKLFLNRIEGKVK